MKVHHEITVHFEGQEVKAVLNQVLQLYPNYKDYKIKEVIFSVDDDQSSHCCVTAEDWEHTVMSLRIMQDA